MSYPLSKFYLIVTKCKIDALGLKSLDIIKTSMDLAGLDYSWYDSEDYSDPKVYEMLRNGDTTDIFQMAGFMATKLIQDFEVNNIDGLCAVNAGNRPGPLEKDSVTGKSMTDLYSERVKTGIIESIDPRIDPVLKNTFGCIWYQEHVISLGQIMAGYTPGSADDRIRRVLGKKKVKMIPEIRNEFVYGKASEFNEKHEVIGLSDKKSPYCEGSIARGFSEEIANHIFDTMAAFAKYSFNLSHAFCYAVIAYKCAWLSLYHPVEFAVANCTINDDVKDITQTLSLAKKRKIKVLSPDINMSDIGFTCENINNIMYIDKEGVSSNNTKAIRYGLRAIKNVGDKAVWFLKEYRKADNVTFKDFDDFYQRIHDPNNPVVANLISKMQNESGKKSTNPIKKNVELSLIFSGCFDYCEPNRYKLARHYLFDIRKEKTISYKIGDKEYNSFPKWSRKEKLKLEKAFMGVYVSEHPLDVFSYSDFDAAQEGEVIKTSIIVNSASLKDTKRGKKFLTVKGTDKTDSEITVNIFDEEKAKRFRTLLKKNSILIVQGPVSKKFNNINARDAKIAASKPITLESLAEDFSEHREEAKMAENELDNALKQMFS